MVVVVSISGWDGSRVLGAFSNKESALNCLKERNIECNSKNIVFDFVQLDKISMMMSVNPDVDQPLTRTHVYDDKMS